MKILLKYFGNHSNRLMQLAHIEAACMESNQKFLNLCFGDMKKYYNQPNVPFCNIYWLSVLLLRCILKVQRICGISILKVYQYNQVGIDYEKEQPFENLSHYAIIYGFYFRAPSLVKKYKPYFQYAYSLKEKYYKDCQLWESVCRYKEIGYTIVAIHCRRGDYKDWGGGVYYYGNDIYIACMERMIEIMRCSKIKFILFSDENLLDSFSYYDVEISKNEWYVDQFLMSQCNYIIGPPSSFSGWASFIGDVPLYYIRNKEICFNIGDFKISNLETVL